MTDNPQRSCEEIAQELLDMFPLVEKTLERREKIKEALDKKDEEILRLKREVERLQGESSKSLLKQFAHKSQQFLEAMETIQLLKAEVENLKYWDGEYKKEFLQLKANLLVKENALQKINKLCGEYNGEGFSIQEVYCLSKDALSSPSSSGLEVLTTHTRPSPTEIQKPKD